MIVTLMKDELFDHNDECAFYLQYVALISVISVSPFIKLYYSLVHFIITNNAAQKNDFERSKIFLDTDLKIICWKN